MNQEESKALRNAYKEIGQLLKVGNAAKKLTNEVVNGHIQTLVVGEIEANHRFINGILKENGGFTSNFSSE